MRDRQCPLCYVRERVSEKCHLCKGSGRLSEEDLHCFWAGEKAASEWLDAAEGREWLDITVSCIGRKEL